MVTVDDLPEQIGKLGPRALLYCRTCGMEYSAHKGDYFMLPSGYRFSCCGHEMELVTKHVVYRRVKS